MIRPFTCVCLLLAGVSGLYLYQEKHAAHLQEMEIGRIVRQAEQVRARTTMLRAEWALLNDPERLQALATRHLPELQPLTPGQFVQMADLDAHLPPPIQAGPSASAAGEAVAVAQPPADAGTTQPAGPQIAEVAAQTVAQASPPPVTSQTPAATPAPDAPAVPAQAPAPAAASALLASAAPTHPADARPRIAPHRAAPTPPHTVVARRPTFRRWQGRPVPLLARADTGYAADAGRPTDRAPMLQRAAALTLTRPMDTARYAAIPADTSSLGGARSMMLPPPVPLGGAAAR